MEKTHEAELFLNWLQTRLSGEQHVVSVQPSISGRCERRQWIDYCNPHNRTKMVDSLLDEYQGEKHDYENLARFAEDFIDRKCKGGVTPS